MSSRRRRIVEMALLGQIRTMKGPSQRNNWSPCDVTDWEQMEEEVMGKVGGAAAAAGTGRRTPPFLLLSAGGNRK